VFCVQCSVHRSSVQRSSTRSWRGDVSKNWVEPFLGELKLVLELVEGFLEELKLVLKILFFCLLVQQPCSQGCKAESSSISFEVSVAAHALLRGLQYAAIADALLLPRRWPLIPEAPTGSHY